MLLVHDDQTQFGELNFSSMQRVRADDQLRVALRDVAASLALAVLSPREPVSSTMRYPALSRMRRAER